MIFFAKLIFILLRGVDPLVFLAPVCLGLGACFIVLLLEHEKSRVRWRENAMKPRFPRPQSRTIAHRRSRDRPS
jgi:hypothetical protein